MSKVRVMSEENLGGGFILSLDKSWRGKPGCDLDFHISHDLAVSEIKY